MKTLIAIGAACVVAGCVGAQPDTGTSTQIQALGSLVGTGGGSSPGCIDPRNCFVYNGGGVYTEELGHAGLGSADVMVTTFANLTDDSNQPFVAWAGRYPGGDGRFWWTTQVLSQALHKENGIWESYSVSKIDETGMEPSFTLVNADTASPNYGQTIIVGGSDLPNLALVFEFFEEYATMTFGPAYSPPETISHGAGGLLQKYRIYWNPGNTPDESGATRRDYCQRALQGSETEAQREPDYGVFQKGFAVQVLDAKTTFGLSNYMTFSCRLGAIASVHSWGYNYTPPEQQGAIMYEAAMKMKRASYCGDSTFYTRRNTPIYIQDGAGIQHAQTDGHITVDNLEALWGWTPTGVRALCVNPQDERRPGVKYPLDDAGTPFDQKCYDPAGNLLFKMPVCTGNQFAHIYLEDAAAPRLSVQLPGQLMY